MIDKITGRLPLQSFQESVLKLPNINLADSNFNISSEVDILLGVSIFYQSLLPRKRELGKNMPILQDTYFGWVVTGPISTNFGLKPVNCNLVVSNFEKQLKQFWLVDEYPTRKFYSQQESECETIFSETVRRDIDGRFIVTLPVRKKYDCVLGESLDSAVKRLKAMKRKFSKNPNFKERYVKFMREYEELGHMVRIKPESINIDNEGNNLFYLPHHGVINEASTTTSLRVVFDGSCPSSTGKSLNDMLLVGPSIQDKLFSILIRFRRHIIVMTG